MTAFVRIKPGLGRLPAGIPYAGTILNIENYNGNPKMEVLFPLIRTLKIDPWPIFYPELDGQNASFRQMQLLLKECSEEEIEALLPICKAALSVLRSKNVIEIK